MIQIEHLVKYYGDQRAVDDISFQVQPGEILGFLGPNGAGKSTTMNIVRAIFQLPQARLWVMGTYRRAQPCVLSPLLQIPLSMMT